MSPTLELNFWTRLLGILALEIGLVVALAFAVQLLTQSAFWRRTIWQICFVCLLLLVATELTGFGRGLAVWISGKPVAERKFSMRTVPAEEQFVPQHVENEIAPVLIPQIENTPAPRAVWWPGIIWLAGLGLIIARILFARCLFFTLRFQREKINDPNLLERVSELAKRLGIRRKIHLLESNGLSSPMTFGITHPSIGLPSGFAQTLNSAQQDAMLTHELAHLAARDPFWYLLADLAAAFLWWHPLVWFARRRLHSTSELAADEAAAILENGPGTLAECLVQLGQQLTHARSFGWLGVGGDGFRSHLGQRVERLLNLKNAEQPMLRGWPLFFAKTAFVIFFGGLIVFASGWIQNGKEQREKNLSAAVQKSWNGSFASKTLAALAEEKANLIAKNQRKAIEAPVTNHYETVSFETVFYDAISADKLKTWSRTVDSEDDDGVVILSSNQLRRVLRTFSEIPHTHDSVGNKFSGGHFLYRGTITNENECSYFTEKVNGINRVKGAEMTYATTNPWSFSFVPQKLESSVQINLKWPNETDEPATKLEMPGDGGAIVRRSLPGDSTRSQLILFSSVRVLPKTEIERDAKIAVGSLIQDAKLLFEIGKLDEAERKLKQALQIDPESKSAFYYLFKIREARIGVHFKTRELNNEEIYPSIPAELVTPGTLIDNYFPSKRDAPQTLNSDHRTNGVVFSPKVRGDVVLYTHTYKLNPEKFVKALEKFTALGSKPMPNNDFIDEGFLSGNPRASKTNLSIGTNLRAREFFEAAGVDFGTPKLPNGKAIFFSDRTGLLMVRATLEDLEKIQNAVLSFGAETPQITIEAKFVEVDEAAIKKLGSNWFSQNTIILTNQTASGAVSVSGNLAAAKLDVKNKLTNSHSPMITGILTESQYQTALKTLETFGGTDILTTPRLTTLSGRQSQISTLDMQTIVTGASSITNSKGDSDIEYQTESIAFGPILDVLPAVSADGFAIQMTITASITEFLGYDDPGKFVPQGNGTNGGKPLTATMPLPRFRFRQATTIANVWDGQTLMLNAPPAEKISEMSKVKNKVPMLGDLPFFARLFRKESQTPVKRNLIIFITPTIIGSKGDRVHSEKELLFATNSVPKQPERK